MKSADAGGASLSDSNIPDGAPPLRRLGPRARLGAAALFFSLLAVLYTWPLAANLTTHLPGEEAVVDLRHDPALQSWFFWRSRTALTDADEDLLYSRLVHHPRGMEMTLQPNMVGQAALSLLLPGVAFHTALNVVLLLSFAASGLSAYLLGRRVLQHEGGALLCGFVFAFCPYRMQHLVGHYQLMIAFTLPWVALAWWRLLDSADEGPMPWRRIGLAGLALGLTVITDYYTFAYALLLCGWLVAWHLVAKAWAARQAARSPLDLWRRMLGRTLASGAAAFVVASPILLPALASASRSNYAVTAGHENHKADLLSFVVPSARQWLFTPLQPWLRETLDMSTIDGVEHSVYLGWGLLLLCAVAVPTLRRDPVGRLFGATALLFGVLAMGPSLSVGGHGEIPLPGALLTNLPFFESARAPGRTVVLAMLALGVCAGAALRHLLRPGMRVLGLPGRAIAAAGCLWLSLEYVVPIYLARLPDLSVLEQIADDPGPVAHAPLYPTVAALPQAWHGQPVLMPGLGRTDPAVQQYYWRHEALRDLSIPHRIPDPAVTAPAVDLLGLRHILWNRTVLSALDESTLRQLGRAWGMETIHLDSAWALQRTVRPRAIARSAGAEITDPTAELHLLYGWSNRQRFGDTDVSWIVHDEAQLALPPMEERSFRLRLSLWVLPRSGRQPPTMEISAGGQVLGEQALTAGVTRTDVPIPPGALTSRRTNVVTLRPSVPVDRPHRAGHPASAPGHAGLEVFSGGLWTMGQGHAAIVTASDRVEAPRTGVLVAGVDPGDGRLVASRLYLAQPEAASALEIAAFIDSLPPAATVAAAVRGVPFVRDGGLTAALRAVGAPPDLEVGRFNSFAFIGRRDGTAVFSTGAVEAAVGVGPLAPVRDAAIGLLGFELVPDDAER